MSVPKFDSFEEFWPYYVREHSKKTTRLMHFVGTGAALSAFALGLLRRSPALLLAAPLLGYGPAWISHFFVEGNTPATFHYPAFSLRADLRMFGMMLDGAMDREVERVMNQAPSWQQPESGEGDATTTHIAGNNGNGNGHGGNGHGGDTPFAKDAFQAAVDRAPERAN